MSLKLNERYPGRFNNPSAGYPLGSFKNRTAPNAKDGSYLEQDWANDKEGFFQSLLNAAGIEANGIVDKVGGSQYFDALAAVSVPKWSEVDSTTNFNSISTNGWYKKLLGGAPGSRNPNYPGTETLGAQTPVAPGNTMTDFCWLFVANYGARDSIQIAYPYISAASGEISLPTVKWRLKGDGAWGAWRSAIHSGTVLPRATTSTQGQVRLSTVDEARAMSDAQTSLTPYTLDQAFRGQNQTPGVQRLPGGWIIQRGSAAIGSEGSGGAFAVALAVAYPNTYSVIATFGYAGNRNENGNFAQVRGKTPAGFTIDNQWVSSGNDIGGTVDWITIGN